MAKTDVSVFGEARPSNLELDAIADELEQAGKSHHTQRAYLGDLRHFEHEFLGRLPTTPDELRRYVAYCQSRNLSPSTVRRRLSSIAKFHKETDQPDPTKGVSLKDTLKGHRANFEGVTKQARPMTIEILIKCVTHWEQVIRDAANPDLMDSRARRKAALLALRSRAFFLIGFWSAMRADEIVRLKVERCILSRQGEPLSLTLHLPTTKNQSDAKWNLVGIKRCCPIVAYIDWINAAGIKHGNVFRRIDRWGTVGKEGIHINSVHAVMRAALKGCGFDGKELAEFSSHSLRRGFATEHIRLGGDLKDLMFWAKWKSADNALRYIEPGKDVQPNLMARWMKANSIEPTVAGPTLNSNANFSEQLRVR